MRTNGIIQLAPALRVLVLLALGIWVGYGTSDIIPFAVWGIAFVVAIAFTLIVRSRGLLSSTAILLSTFLLGCFVYRTNDLLSKKDIPTGYVDCKSIVSSRISEKGKIVRCDLLITEINGCRLPEPIKVKASILKDTVSNNWRSISVGGGMWHYSKLELLSQFDNTSHFDYPQWMKCHGYTAQTFIPWNKWAAKDVAPDNISYCERARISLQMKVDSFVKQNISPILGSGQGINEGLAILLAMTLGDKSHIDKDISESFSVAGASHILALSGLHLGILFGLLTFFFGKNSKRNGMVQLLTIGIVWTYVVMVGMSVSIMRAATMLTLYSIIGLACRARMSLNIFAVTGCIMLITNPLLLWDVGFQLSFLSVACILTIYHNIFNILKVNTKVGRLVWGSIAISLAAQIGTAPLVAYYFGRFSCYFIIVNIIVIPMATIIIFGTVIGVILTAIYQPCAIIFWGLAAVAHTMNKIISIINNLPYASIENINIHYKQVVAYYLILIVMIFVINRKMFR